MQNTFIVIWSTHLKLVFCILSIIVKALFIARHLALCKFIVESCHLWFELHILLCCLTSSLSWTIGHQRRILGAGKDDNPNVEVCVVWWVISCSQLKVVRCSIAGAVIMNAVISYFTYFGLCNAISGLQETSELIMEPWGKYFTSKLPFCPKRLCTWFSKRKTSTWIFSLWVLKWALLYGLLFWFRSCVTTMSHSWWLYSSGSHPLLSELYQKSNALSCHFILCSVSIFQTQHANYFW